QEEWANARGAIARFSRNAIEIRLIDAQECPAADLAVTAAVIGAVKLLVSERWSDVSRQQAWPSAPLAKLLDRTIAHGDQARIEDAAYLEAFGYRGAAPCTAGRLWQHL